MNASAPCLFVYEFVADMLDAADDGIFIEFESKLLHFADRLTNAIDDHIESEIMRALQPSLD